MDNIDLSIIIVSWNVKDLLLQCLCSIYQNQNNLFLEVIVVDNASSDSSQETVKQKFPQVILITNNQNKGFAQACNQGIEKSQGRYLLFLNPDTQVSSTTFDNYLQRAKIISQLGVLGCKLLNSDNTIQPSVRHFPRFWLTLGLLLKLHLIFPTILKYYEAFDFDYQKEQEVDQVMGAAFLVPKNVIERVGNFDPHFFLWLEEVDFCWRCKNADFKVVYTPYAEIFHKKGQSFGQLLPYQRQKQFIKSMLYFSKKHKPNYQYLILWLIRPISLFLSWIQTKLKIKMNY